MKKTEDTFKKSDKIIKELKAIMKRNRNRPGVRELLAELDKRITRLEKIVLK